MDPSPALPASDHHDVLDVPVLVRRTHALLAARVPLTLLLDLVEDDPRSARRYSAEGGDASWLPRPRD